MRLRLSASLLLWFTVPCLASGAPAQGLVNVALNKPAVGTGSISPPGWALDGTLASWWLTGVCTPVFEVDLLGNFDIPLVKINTNQGQLTYNLSYSLDGVTFQPATTWTGSPITNGEPSSVPGVYGVSLSFSPCIPGVAKLRLEIVSCWAQINEFEVWSPAPGGPNCPSSPFFTAGVTGTAASGGIVTLSLAALGSYAFGFLASAGTVPPAPVLPLSGLFELAPSTLVILDQGFSTGTTVRTYPFPSDPVLGGATAYSQAIGVTSPIPLAGFVTNVATVTIPP